MCGIAGIWNCAVDESAGRAPADRLSDMLAAMAHRGPDGRGTMEFAGGAAGMVRLALVDLSPRGNQPLWSACRRVAILFNGEIYNFREERERLAAAGYSFQTTTDTEVILALYLERGVEVVERLRGMYAFAIFDWRESECGGRPTVTLFRSPFGIKPLYIAQPGGESLVFASELRSLLASGLVERQIDRDGLADYLGYGFVVQPRTIIEGVRMLESGTWERYVPGQPVKIVRYWSLPTPEPRDETIEESTARLRHELEDSVRLHALADAPVGAFLSGGIDSTAVVALMRRHIPDLHTYTFKFPELAGGDESERAVASAKHLGVRSTIVEVTGRDAAEAMPRFAGDLDQPSADGLNTWMISRAAARDVKAVLSGLGGDELFAGYNVARRMQRLATTAAGRVQSIAGGLAHFLRPAAADDGLIDRLAARRSPASLWLHAHRVFPLRRACKMAGLRRRGDIWDAEETRFLAAVGLTQADVSPVDLACRLDVFAYLRSQLLRDSDAASMAHSLELRIPFIDPRIISFSRTCRDDYKLPPRPGPDGLETKVVLTKALADLLPPHVASAPKRGFSMPYAEWIRGALQPLVEEACRPEVVRRRGLIDPQFVEPLYAARKTAPAAQAYPQLWSLMILELWCRAVLDVSPRPARTPAVTHVA